ncbi:MAG: DUF3489 domain-containing protein [Paraglaciecola sp.]|nr:DUF3489 domain-containing protein [Paraglaciecola sp.]
MSQLTPTQITILTAAAKRPDGNIEPMPDNINAGIKPRVIQGLLTRELIITNENGHAIAPLGYQAIGLEPEPNTTNAEAGVNLREGTKQARMITLLQRPEGASIEDICQETGWQKHTVRGVFSNTLKKRLGLTLTSYKNEGQPRHYQIIDDKT